jgi:hypothetical protein
MKCYRGYAVLLFVMFLSACTTPAGKDGMIVNAMKPMPWIFKQMPEHAPEEYKKGWKEGCESGLASMTNDYYKTFYTFKQDAGLIKNEIYYKAWKDTFNFCRHYAYGIVRESNTRMRTPDDPDQFSPYGQGIDNMTFGGGATGPKGVFGSKVGNSDFLDPKSGGLFEPSDGFLDMGQGIEQGPGRGLFGNW